MRPKRIGILAAGVAFAGGTAGMGAAVASAQTGPATHHAVKAAKVSTTATPRAVNAAPAYPGVASTASGTTASKTKSKHTCPNMGSSPSKGSSSSSSTTASFTTY